MMNELREEERGGRERGRGERVGRREGGKKGI